MSGTQHILVCSEDGVLAKRVRYLLARDDTEVEILSTPNTLEQRLGNGGVSLLILSQPLGGEDSSEILRRLEPAGIPPTIVLGGSRDGLPPGVDAIADAADTHTLYKLASLALEGKALGAPAGEADLASHSERKFAQRTERTESPALAAKDEALEDVDLGDDLEVDVDEPEDGETKAGGDQDITVFDVARYHAGSSAVPQPRPKRSTPPKRSSLSGPLQPKRLARAFYLCSARNADGALMLDEPQETLTVYFEKGVVIHVESNMRGDLLGRNLVKRSVLSEDQYSECAKLAIEKGLSIGQATVELGYFSKEALGREMGEDAFEQIIKRFSAKDGSFEFHQDRRVRTKERPYRLEVGRILASGLRHHCADDGIDAIVGEIEGTYFKLRSSVDTLSTRFPISEREKEFLAYSGRAYNVQDAAEGSELSKRDARVLMALLVTCDEVDPFTPGVAEFEDRIKDERQKNLELEKQVSMIPKSAPPSQVQSSAPPVVISAPPPAQSSAPPRQSAPPSSPPSVTDTMHDPVHVSEDIPLETSELSANSIDSEPDAAASDSSPANPITLEELEGDDSFEFPLEGGLPQMIEDEGDVPGEPMLVIEKSPSVPPFEPKKSQPPPVPAEPPKTLASAPPPALSIPPMPEPNPGTPGRIPRPVVFSPPVPRGDDGALMETPERARSRQFFQKGVALLGQGSFDEAEEGFRDAIALCADEHVYLIGLARAIYYNPSYTAAGKLPVLKSIVGRATGLAPDDQRVRTLHEWVDHAAAQVEARA